MVTFFRLTGNGLATTRMALRQPCEIRKLTTIGLNLIPRSGGKMSKNTYRCITSFTANERHKHFTFIINQAKKLGFFTNNLQRQLGLLSDDLLKRCYLEIESNKNKPYAQQDTFELVNKGSYEDLIEVEFDLEVEPLVVEAKDEVAQLTTKKNQNGDFLLSRAGNPRFKSLKELETFICFQYLELLNMTNSKRLFSEHNSERFRRAINQLYTLVQVTRSYGQKIENPLFLRHFQESLQHELNEIDKQFLYNDWILRAAGLYANKKNSLIYLMDHKYLKNKDQNSIEELKEMIRRLGQVGNFTK